MNTTKRALLAVTALVVAVLAVVAITTSGGKQPLAGHKKVHSVTLQNVPTVHTCNRNDYVMQCALNAPAKAPHPSLGAPTAQRVYAHGVDTAWGGPSTTSLRNAGKTFVFSYFSYDLSKNWTAGLVNAYHSSGIKTGGVWESSQFRPQQGCSAGIVDAQTARNQAAAVGNRTRPIYFAVDFDTTNQTGSIFQYFRCVRSQLGSRTGAYGGLATISYLFDQRLINYGWQTYAWSSGRWDARAQLQQYLNDVNIGGVGTDLDRAVAPDYAQWPYNVPKPPPPRVHCFGTKAQPNNAHCRQVRALVSKRSRARDATIRAITRNRCAATNPPNKHNYKSLNRWYPHVRRRPQLCGKLRQRVVWFESRVHADLY